MTITISGTKSISTGTLGNPIYSYSPFSTYPMVSVTDTATQTVTLTVVQSSFLHSNPGASNDVTSPVQPGAFTLRFYANGGMETNPPTISGNTFTVTGPLNSTNVGTYNPSGSPMYGPVAYSPIDSLTFLQAAVPTARLVGNQILETDFTLTATDSTGGIATQLTKYLSTNPVQAAFATALGTANAQAITKPFAGLAVTNTNDIVFNRYTDNGVFISTTYGSTTITVTQTNILHTDPALSGGDQRISVAPGTLSFTAQGGDATNAPTFDPTTGTLVATGTIRSPALGTADPIDYPSGYTPHDYSPAQEVSNLTFAPASSIHLSANQTLETDFTLTVTDGVTGSSQVLTRAQTLTAPTTNPITVTNVAVSTSSGTLVAGQTIAFTLALSGSVSISGGLPTITLNDGGTATYSPAASTATSLTFNYTVGLGDATTSLALARLNLNGSAIAASGSNLTLGALVGRRR